MSYITSNEKLNKVYQELDKQRSDELYASRTTAVDSNHPLVIAAEKSIKDYEEGKLLSLSDAIQQLIDIV